MQITNNHNLPESFVNFARNDKYSKGKSDISVTTLIDSPRVKLLREANSAQLTSDASDMIWPLFGTAVHHILESSKNDEGVTLEERLYADVNGWILSGAVDHQKTDGKTISITDYKVTSVWSVIYGKIEWEQQLNCYAFLAQKNRGMKVKSLQICAILRDWNRREAERKEEYPKAPVVLIDIPIWPDTKRIEYIKERIAMHQDAQVGYDLSKDFPLCSDEERWKRGEAWAVKKKGLKRAMRVFDNQEEAEVYAYDWEKINNGKIAVVEHRAGEYVRCNGDYCGVANFCSQFKGDIV
tara:strand:- start:2319 stop:3206 length:888 start_codon:yes stop_codon:yes gene_type:complete